MKRELKTGIDIDAPPEAVWRVLLDFPRYSEWNDFIQQIEGTAQPGVRLCVRIRTPSGHAHLFRPMLLQVTPPRVLRWLGWFGAPGVFDGEHGFFLEPLPDRRTRLIQTERFSGFLVLFLWRRLEAFTAESFAAFNQALKRRVESRT